MLSIQNEKAATPALSFLSARSVHRLSSTFGRTVPVSGDLATPGVTPASAISSTG
jgi:hypothetical protein